ncbi:hypothetical protein RHSIM_Rhsim13G0147400 [Rhododendron simsii]|uniref:PPM-type phosphatase domain-containing protein n=1 Tax=Rhododendron simsii TaxID=118357 RepID=A0A834G0S5_RHOSS|nr:hypothetical protein RHSIM_Rhsim13G0147400 [Rhododendron simsii]
MNEVTEVMNHSVASEVLEQRSVVGPVMLSEYSGSLEGTSQAAFENNLAAGSTAVVTLLVDGQILVANVGASISYLPVKELTSDHNPHTDEERARIEAAGGVISWYDMPIINDWQPLAADDNCLVVASDGILESLKPQKVCHLIRDAHFQDTKKSKQLDSSLDQSSLANCIVRNAFKKGSTDNLSAVVVLLRSASFSPAKS